MSDTGGSLIIIGGGNHSADIQAIARRCGVSDVFVYDDDVAAGKSIPESLDGDLVIGVNDPVIRRQIARRLNIIDGAPPLVDPAAILGSHVCLGPGVVVAPAAVLLTNVIVGLHSHINYAASMTRCKVGDFCTISPGATICGNVEIGNQTTIGAGSTICERTKIGDRVIIGAGAVVPPYSVVPDGTIVKGIWKGFRARG